MSVENEPTLEPPTCSLCGVEMEFRAGGTEKTIPVIGSEVGYQRFGCPECGQGARYERGGPDEEWSRAGV
ncbi:hypothetical protein [Halosolutus halophilus]|uniref:hypothetical protein n=1 Tax=Halosolutus halophilus TaxID=1552990 RepID=UPI0022352568|nr:hypothetical protein [Halosolutus halophilus]